MDSVFEFQSITKRFKQHVALDNVSMRGERGQVIALLGENGAGKTTAIKILLGLLAPDGGASRVMGLDSQTHGAEIRRRVGYMPDRPALYEWMTVREIGWFAAGFYPLGFQQRYEDLVQRFGLDEKPIKSLSKGMQGKVSLSLAMAHEPDLLVLDEPTSGLDPLVRREFLESMIEIAAEGRTVLLSSHQIAEVERVADIVAVLRGGKLILCEPLDVLKDRVSEVIVTLADIETAPPELAAPALLLRAQRHDRVWRLMVRDLDDAGRLTLNSDPNHLHVEEKRLSLEEIFVACMITKADGFDPTTIGLTPRVDALATAKK
ncbi:MAG: ABC transporter ATP-binding protein [Planctomycetales bacterium]|nr:ABC transporter ATP-binding protein [Planctomycetales bacterium]